MKSGADVRHRIGMAVLDGSSVSIESDFDFGPVWNSFASVVIEGGQSFQLASGSTQLGSEVATNLGLVFDEAYSLGGGRLAIGEVVQRDDQGGSSRLLALGVWEGKSRALITHSYVGGRDSIHRIFARLSIAEDENGISTRLLDPGIRFVRDSARGPRLTRRVPDLGRLTVGEMTEEIRSALPAGLPAQDGEIYKDEDHDSMLLLHLANETAFATLAVAGTVSHESAFARISTLAIDWRGDSR
jgi:hypothetical protein